MSEETIVVVTPRVRRLGLAAFLSMALGFAILTVIVAVESYPARNGLVLENGTLVGGDFVSFWIGGHLFLEDRSRLYDLDHQRRIRAERLGPADDVLDGELPFVYPPLVAALVAPLSRLGLQPAFWIFATFGLFAALSALLLLARTAGLRSPVHLGMLCVAAAGFVPFGLNTVLGGQFPWLGIVVLSLVAAAVLAGRDGVAGLGMSLSYYKPPLFLLMLVTLLLARSRRFLAGFAVGAALLMGATVVLVGWDGLMAYLSVVTRYTYGQDLTETLTLPTSAGMGVVALGAAVLGSMEWALLVLAPVAVYLMMLAVREIRRGRLLPGLTLAIVTSLAFSFQYIKYDLALLLVPMVLVVAWGASSDEGPGPALFLALGAFYLEFPLRGVVLGRVEGNVTWLLFPVLLTVLAREARRFARS